MCCMVLGFLKMILILKFARCVSSLVHGGKEIHSEDLMKNNLCFFFLLALWRAGVPVIPVANN